MFAFVITTGMAGLRNASSWRQILAILLASSVIAIHSSKTVKPARLVYVKVVTYKPPPLHPLRG